jgi:hypothetical protein
MTETKIIFSVQESPEGGYEARGFDHPIFTQADSIEKLHAMVRDAISCHFGAEIHYKLVYPRSSA